MTTKNPQKLDIQQEAVCLSVRLGHPRTNRRVSTADIQTDADQSMVHVAKDIYESEALQAITRTHHDIYHTMKAKCLPSPFRNGVYLVSMKMLPTVLAYLDKKEKEIEEMIDEFIPYYETIYNSRNDPNSELRRRLGSLYDSSDYPHPQTLRATFRFETQMWELSTPGKLKGISKDLYRREHAKMLSVWDEAQKTITQVLLTEFRALTNKMVDRLTPNADGTEKKFKNSLVGNLQEWLSIFDQRTLTDDEDLVALVKKARALVSGVDADDLRESEVLKKELSAGMQQITKQLDLAIIDKPARMINLDE